MPIGGSDDKNYSLNDSMVSNPDRFNESSILKFQMPPNFNPTFLMRHSLRMVQSLIESHRVQKTVDLDVGSPDYLLPSNGGYNPRRVRKKKDPGEQRQQQTMHIVTSSNH